MPAAADRMSSMAEIWRRALAPRPCPPQEPQAVLVGPETACAAVVAALNIPPAPSSALPVRRVRSPPLLVAPDESTALSLAPNAAVLLKAFLLNPAGFGDISRGCLTRKDGVRVVLVGVVDAEDAKGRDECASAQVSVRRTALKKFGGCAVALLVRSDGDMQPLDDRERGKAAEKVDDEAPSLVGLLGGRVFESRAVAQQGDGTFFAHEGWDTHAKIQALVDASGTAEPKPIHIDDDKEVYVEGAHTSVGDGSASTSESDREDSDASDGEDESAWLSRFCKMCSAEGKENSARDQQRKTQNGDAMERRNSDADVRDTKAGGREPVKLVRAGTAPRPRNRSGVGASFFQQLRTEETKR